MSTTPPTSAQEALDLAWNLAHPLKEGQAIPEGTRLLDRSGRNDLSAYSTQANITINARESLSIRTLDPLPDPLPDWLDTEARTSLPEALAALQAVLDMHNDSGDGLCNECSDGFLVNHPCPTVRAIQDAMRDQP